MIHCCASIDGARHRMCLSWRAPTTPACVGRLPGATGRSMGRSGAAASRRPPPDANAAAAAWERSTAADRLAALIVLAAALGASSWTPRPSLRKHTNTPAPSCHLHALAEKRPPYNSYCSSWHKACLPCPSHTTSHPRISRNHACWITSPAEAPRRRRGRQEGCCVRIR